jgi:putative addiction module CopG family antidote
MNVQLTRELERFIARTLATGRYESASDVVCDGLRLLAAKDEMAAAARRKVAQGLAQAKAGKTMDADEVVAALLGRIRSGRRRHAAG